MKKLVLVGLSAMVLVACSPSNEDVNDTGSNETKVEQVDVASGKVEKTTPISQGEYDELLAKRQDGERPEGYDELHLTELVPKSEGDYVEDYSKYNKLTPEEGTKVLTEGETRIIYFGWTECIYCYRFRQSYDHVLDDLNLTIDYLEVDDLKGMGDNARDLLFGAFGVNGVPAVLAIKDGKEISRIDQDTLSGLDYEQLLEWTYENAQEVGLVE